MLNKFNIKVTPDSGTSWIEMDGKRIDNVKRVEICAEVNEVPTVALTYFAEEVKIELEGEKVPR